MILSMMLILLNIYPVSITTILMQKTRKNLNPFMLLVIPVLRLPLFKRFAMNDQFWIQETYATVSPYIED